MSTCRIAHCLVIGMCILAIDVAMYAQSTPAFTNKATDPKATQIGWFLEQEFSPYFYNCSNKQSMKTKKGVVVSTVPVPILTNIQGDVWNWVYNKLTYSAATAFTIISPDGVSPKFPAGCVPAWYGCPSRSRDDVSGRD